LYFSTQGKEHRVIQITSPDPGDGKTTLASNLAISIAQSGKRVLVVDADFRRPKLAKLFGVDDSQSGFAMAITGAATMEQAVQRTNIDNLDIMPCGPRPRNPSELLTSSGFKEMVDNFRESYDFVILDSPPLLVVADATIVAAQSDAVMLVIRLRKNARDHAVQALEMLHTVDAHVAGVVVNGISRATGYSRYRNGYGYGYGYGYKYSYKQYSSDYAYGDPEPGPEAGNGNGNGKPKIRQAR
jgi:capsular exopolysaccharide synthesis family protein